MLVSNFPSFGFTFDNHSDDSRGIIYDRNMFIVQPTGVNVLLSFVTILSVNKLECP
jgi:hypothetical protein